MFSKILNLFRGKEVQTCAKEQPTQGEVQPNGYTYVSGEERATIVRLYEEGKSTRQIAASLSRAPSTIHYHLSKEYNFLSTSSKSSLSGSDVEYIERAYKEGQPLRAIATTIGKSYSSVQRYTSNNLSKAKRPRPADINSAIAKRKKGWSIGAILQDMDGKVTRSTLLKILEENNVHPPKEPTYTVKELKSGKRKRVTTDEKQKRIKLLWENGYSMAQIAQATGFSSPTVHRYVRERMNLKGKSGTTASHTTVSDLTDKEMEDVVLSYKKGESVKSIISRYDGRLSESCAYSFLRRKGVELNRRKKKNK